MAYSSGRWPRRPIHFNPPSAEAAGGIDDPVTAMLNRFRLTTGQLLGVLLIAGLAIYLSFYPLWHTDVWAHAKYGEWYWQHRTTPAVEPLSPFTDKETPFANVAWLSQ